MAGLIWMIRNIRHVIKTTKTEKTTVVFTDYTVNIWITKQTILTNNNIDKFNLRLMSQFRLNVKYRSGKNYIIPNVLSCLFSGNKPIKLPRKNPADFINLNIYFFGLMDPSDNPDNYLFQKKIINISDEFKQKIMDGYIRENKWNKLNKNVENFGKTFSARKKHFPGGDKQHSGYKCNHANYSRFHTNFKNNNRKWRTR